MTAEFWQKQAADQPLFPDILWSRPENRQAAGKLLIIGGNSHGFAVPAQAYQTAINSGIGSARVLLPDVLQKTVGPVMAEGEFAPSTPSGGFGKDALNEFLTQANWADGVVLGGELGRNAETSILLEQFVQKYDGPLAITRDAVDYFYHQPALIAERTDTAIVLSLSQLQKLGVALHFGTPFLLSMGLMLLVQALHDFTTQYPAVIITKELDTIVVAQGGRIVTTKLAAGPSEGDDPWRVPTATAATVFWLQNPAKPLEAMATSLTSDLG